MRGDGGKILGTFYKSFDVRMLQIKTCPDKTRRVEEESFTFGQKVTTNQPLTLELFVFAENNISSLMPNFG